MNNKEITNPNLISKPNIRKGWATPSISQLPVNKTLGGHIANTTESYTGS